MQLCLKVIYLINKFSIMAKVQHYRGLNTDLDKLYNSIKQMLEEQKDLQIVSEYKGLLNAVPLRSIVAVNKSACQQLDRMATYLL